MITLKELRWANAFSYGDANSIRFDTAPITQLVGKNGHGKSSIALILEEVLFNKNSKNIKKSDILNRYVKDKAYWIELDFERDNKDYTIKTVRGNTQTVKLLRDNIDISSHTATATYKTIEELIGMDHKAFSQIVYQSNASSLEFLTATDTHRKKFLMDFFDLEIYSKASELFKELSSDLSKDIAVAEAKVTTVTAWLEKYENADLSVKPTVEVPELDPAQLNSVTELTTQINNVEAINKKIGQNNVYKKLQSDIVLVAIPERPDDGEVTELKSKVAVHNKVIGDAEAFIKKMRALHGTCPTCLSNIDDSKVQELVTEKQFVKNTSTQSVASYSAKIAHLQQLKLEYDAAIKSQDDWEKYHRLIDPKLDTVVVDKADLQKQMDTLTKKIADAKTKIKTAQDYNRQIEAHNARAETVARQLVEFNSELETHSEVLHNLSERMGVLNVLTKTFSTNGLIAYKIESLVKDLESITNEYLVDLSDGRFQITFQVSSRDKLNVVITDNGKDIDIMALSGGERARVNAATLLAIRRLMQSLSSSRINLLILDETVEALDVDGKERLIETLLKEESLNTFLVSHGFTHPLLEKVFVVKNQNISKIEV
jgi:DNA repair exonuclease SbcCD ATPase subunit